MAKGYKKGSLLMEYFLNPHFKPTEKEMQELTREDLSYKFLNQCTENH